jgi:PKD repeat protein
MFNLIYLAHMKRLIFLLFFFAASFALKAQTIVTVSGHVSDTNSPVGAGQMVLVVYDRDSLSWEADTVFTDSMGFYTSTHTVTSIQGPISASTFCGGVVITEKGFFSPGNLNLTIDLNCLPSTVCSAYYVYKSFTQSNITVFNAIFSPSGSATYTWDFDDGTTGSGICVTHVYPKTGVYNVCLTVSDSIANCSDTYCEMVTIDTDSINCYASFFYKENAPGTVNFTANGFNPVSTATHHWDFGDGTTGTGNPTSHQYAQPGCYLVCLTVTDSINNCVSTSCQGLFVRGNTGGICDASFDIFMNVDSTGSNFTVFLSPQIILPATAYHWNFGDGTTGNQLFEIHTYSGAGTYNVCLIIADSMNNCSDTVCQTILLDGVKMQLISLGMKNEEKNVLIHKAYPNPVENMISVELNSLKNDNCTFTIRDMMGREVFKETKMMNAGNSEWRTNVSELPSGIYFIEAKSSSQISETKFIKK